MTDPTTPNTFDDATHEQTAGRSPTPLIIAMVILAVAVVVYFATGMPGMDHSSSNGTHDMSDMSDMSMPSTHRLLDPAGFAVAIVDPNTITINVHVPAADIQLDGTELTMPFDNLDMAALPSNRDAPLAVYCRSGSMSAIAVKRLLTLGYTNVFELDGGTEAWAAAGK